MQQTVGEHMSTFRIGGQLNLVDCQKIHVDFARHGLNGRHPETRLLRLDLLLARDKGDLLETNPVTNLVVNLSRQKAQRQTDHSGLVTQHPLNSQMCLASIGRPQNRRDVPNTGVECTTHDRGPSGPEPKTMPRKLA